MYQKIILAICIVCFQILSEGLNTYTKYIKIRKIKFAK